MIAERVEAQHGDVHVSNELELFLILRALSLQPLKMKAAQYFFFVYRLCGTGVLCERFAIIFVFLWIQEAPKVSPAYPARRHQKWEKVSINLHKPGAVSFRRYS